MASGYCMGDRNVELSDSQIYSHLTGLYSFLDLLVQFSFFHTTRRCLDAALKWNLIAELAIAQFCFHTLSG